MYTTDCNYFRITNYNTTQEGYYKWTGALQVPFKGTVGIIRMYNTSLTAPQVLQNFDADKSIFGL
jgi:hypothetical protein